MSERTVEGIGYLSFFDEGKWFQGSLITKDKLQYGLLGEESEQPSNQYHECCFDEEPMFYTLTLINFESKEDKVFHHVMKTNGDNCSLMSDNITFYTDEILTGEKALKHTRKFCSSKLKDKEAIVCVGEMVIKLQDEANDT
ncbi:uncharacterized protein LOC116301151 [Actinia tenebrosa]|uniref:Uncharacterized protein LOC116301151 n=1 Tax=Actinia tenebrosa TaxID=6105 RepID=A0A6P8IH32_ACTTE|nr:uncharacterized protein LOC116301151 [Actinia tenebrosa]